MQSKYRLRLLKRSDPRGNTLISIPFTQSPNIEGYVKYWTLAPGSQVSPLCRFSDSLHTVRAILHEGVI